MKNNILLLLLLFGLLGEFLMGYKSVKNDLYITEQNLIASNDSLSILKDKNGELLYEKSTFILKEKELNDMIDISKKEIENLEKQLKASISYISKLETNIKIDTVHVDHFIPVKDSTSYNFLYDDKWFNFNGTINLSGNSPNLDIYNINIPTVLQVGLTEDNKMFVKSDNPYMKIADIKGSYIIENIPNTKYRPKFSHGIQFGIGIQYGICNKNVDVGPYLGYGVAYNF